MAAVKTLLGSAEEYYAKIINASNLNRLESFAT